MKKATSTKKWLWLVSVVAVLVAMACMFTACGDKQEETQPTEIIPTDLYWNLDKALYTENSDTGLSNRERGDDGLYHVRFATAGKLVELTTGDAQMANYIDTMEVMGLILDADGNIADAVPVGEFAMEVAKEFFVKSVEGNNVQLNSSPAMNGMDINIVIPETAFVMDVRRDTETPAEKIELDTMDTVWVYGDLDNVITNVMLTKRPPQSELYLRLNRFYSNGQTTRVPDENGVYTIPFAVNGEVVELKCKDKDLVSSIDSGTDTGVHMGLVFDEEGYIIDDMSGAEAVRGIASAVVFHVKEINGDQVTFIRKLPTSNQGTEVTLTVNENTMIFNSEEVYMGIPCWCFDYPGQLTDHLEIDDRVICYADSKGNALVIDVCCRMVDSKLYYNKKVMYNSTKEETTRVPNEDGYYVYDFSCEGKDVTYKTKSKAIASKIDSFGSGIVGLKLSGSTIKGVCAPYCVAGSNTTSKLIAREVLGNVVTLTSRWDIGNVGGNYVISGTCKAFDVTGNPGVKFGSKTTVQAGDHVYGMRNPYGELEYIYVTKRVVSGTKLYYNTWRRIDTTTNTTTRPADEEGYYVYDLLTEKGKLVQGKTKSKEMADFIDLQLAPFVALKINSQGIITKAAFCESALQWGMKYTNYHYISKIDYNAKTYSTYYMSNGEKIPSYNDVPIADDVKMYNFSTNFVEYRGEKTKVRKDDRIQAFYDAGQNKVSHIYVLERYGPDVKKYCPHCDKKVTFHGYKNGAAPAGQVTHYYLDNNRSLSQLSVGATKVDNNPENKRTEVILDLNGKTLSGASSRCALVYGDLTVFDSVGGGGMTGNINGWAGVLLIRETGKVNLLGGTYKYTDDETRPGSTVGGVFWVGEQAELNIHPGVKVINGRTSGNGGLIYMEGSAVVNIDGAEIGNGLAASGGNFYLTGSSTLNLKNCDLVTGTSNNGSNFCIASKTATVNLENVTYDGGIAVTAARNYPITGTVNWTEPVILRNGAKLDLTGMDPASKLAIDAEGVFSTNFESAAKAKEYLNCFTVPQDFKPVEVVGKALATELELQKLLDRELPVANAVKDMNPAEVVAGTTCPMCGAENITWKKQEGAYWAALSSSKNHHIYYEGAVGTAGEPLVSSNFIGGDEGINVCVVLVDADIHTTGRILMRPNNTFCIMGKGNFTSDGTSTGSGVERDRGVFNLYGAPIELNLYGGNYQYTGTGFGLDKNDTAPSTTNAAYALLNLTNGATANIFNDVVIGNAQKDTSRAYYNVYTAGKVNLFGGTIQNGVTGISGAGGNVTIAANGVVNMYGGTIQDGTGFYRGGNVVVKGGGVLNMELDGSMISGGTAPSGGGNIYLGESATMNMHGGTVKGGTTDARGGNINFVSYCVINIDGENALITEGTAQYGGNIGTPDYIKDASVNLKAGTISKGKATSNDTYNGGGNIFAYGWNEENKTSLQININGGLVTEGEAYHGGNIFVRNHVGLNIGKDAVISKGYARSMGGNIMPFNGPVIVSEGKITEGTAAYGGGNINIGHSSGGKSYFTMNGGEISYGTVTGKTSSNHGGNVRLWDNSTFTINDGYIYGGFVDEATTHAPSSNIMAGGNKPEVMTNLNINGGHIAGDIKLYAYGGRQAYVTLTGAPEIAFTITLADGETKASATTCGMLAMNGITMNIDGLKPEASILLSSTLNAAFTVASENAAAVKDCFIPGAAGRVVELTAENVLRVVSAS